MFDFFNSKEYLSTYNTALWHIKDHNEKDEVIKNTSKIPMDKIEVERNIDTLIAEIDIKNENFIQLQKITRKQVASPISCLRTINEEFSELEEGLKNINKDHFSHEHPKLDIELNKMSKETNEIGINNKIIQRDTIKLARDVSLFSNIYIVNIVNRAKLIEDKNKQLRELLAELTKMEDVPQEILPTTETKFQTQSMDSNKLVGVSNWVLQKLKLGN